MPLFSGHNDRKGAAVLRTYMVAAIIAPYCLFVLGIYGAY